MRLSFLCKGILGCLVLCLNFGTMHAQSDSLPIITGTLNDTLFQTEWFRKWSQNEAYQPDAALLEALKSVPASEIRVDVYMGTWCSDSQLHVPAFLKIAAALHWQFRMVGVNREKECPFEKKDCKTWDIQYLPTFVLFRNGQELGRIVEQPQQRLEQDFLKMLQP